MYWLMIGKIFGFVHLDFSIISKIHYYFLFVTLLFRESGILQSIREEVAQERK